ncbi:uncharacterized protein ASCRUDRAFT_80600 [Ascoidea rubescens DSM 1968]|uniref:Uncharacterized protein n=1 Tax=Ascoidea rubescens DSM 1968 TaxID=1344418 RepID=A0A1D2VHC9_9ASCO|nr:hypothetical protein ASCRUDRAFT_81239 [Ascoidea rubescens DSM 1968]XP_020047849.1 hypothetical protein ASCRUDRAFT_80600 [Ascoidea rubescens DSM 1968]ODV60903.1 hypothetical protein ASCRUDRAFT_81239 [Ascoidea rubescens DSM 1968]ODV61542.1 hypothetical protein ASCRUDRAFT_80600 [Ascoidea rubescens DSM 1968]
MSWIAGVIHLYMQIITAAVSSNKSGLTTLFYRNVFSGFVKGFVAIVKATKDNLLILEWYNISTKIKYMLLI